MNAYAYVWVCWKYEFYNWYHLESYYNTICMIVIYRIIVVILIVYRCFS